MRRFTLFYWATTPSSSARDLRFLLLLSLLPKRCSKRAPICFCVQLRHSSNSYSKITSWSSNKLPHTWCSQEFPLIQFYPLRLSFRYPLGQRLPKVTLINQIKKFFLWSLHYPSRSAKSIYNTLRHKHIWIFIRPQKRITLWSFEIGFMHQRSFASSPSKEY